jgi:peptide/nickel transport system ATP-binding protein
LVLVTHNLGVVARYAQRVYVMYAGRIVEVGPTKEIFAHPRHPYTVGLLKSVPRLDQARDRKLIPIEGLPPNLIKMPPTCAFLPRCPYRISRCEKSHWPALTPVGEHHSAACFVNLEDKPIEISSLQSDSELRVTSSAQVNRQVENKTLLDVKHLKMYFPVTRGLMRKKVADVKAVDDVSFHVNVGETLGLVGESGCGKTTLGRGILRLIEPTAGEVFFEGQNLLTLSSGKMRQLRRKMSLMFQDPYGSLDPRQSAGSIVGEALIIHKMTKSKAEYHERVEHLFHRVGLDPSMIDRVPHEFSGGQRQRIGIARALACDPSLIICDEPISALDVSIQAQIINLMKELQQGIKGLTYIFIAHDLSVVRHISDRVAVMYLGHIVEITDSNTLYQNPLHPYTKALLSAVPIADPVVEEKRERILLKGEVPSPLNPPSGCPFHPRCYDAIPDCQQISPQLRQVGNRHEVACIRVV